MNFIDRRNFLSLISGSIGAAAMTRCIPLERTLAFTAAPQEAATAARNECWLEVCAPFLVESPEQGIRTEIFLTSDTFVGRKGYQDGADATEYEIYLYDAEGNPVGQQPKLPKQLVVPAMQTTVLQLSEIIGDKKTFWGGMKIRLRPKGRQAMHASDLFSSAFVRWKTGTSFDNVHANPDPWEWKRPDSFFYSMPFPPLEQYESVFSLFNPNSERSAGTIAFHTEAGDKLKQLSYDLKPHSSLLLNLRRGEFVSDFAAAFMFRRGAHPDSQVLTPAGGTLAIINQPGTTKSFGYMLIKRGGSSRFSVEHPIHQPPFKPMSTPAPFAADGRFKPKNILYTPLVFHAKQIGGVTLESRFHFSAGAPIEEFLWMKPFITDQNGNIAWQVTSETGFPSAVSAKQIQREAIRLGGMESCTFGVADIALPQTFSGGMSLAVAPTTNHTLMKVELRVKEWGAHAFTHFRPGLQSARGYQNATPRGGLATDYIACGARLEKNGSRIVRDEIVGVINIDDKALPGKPALEVFGSGGLIARIELGEVPAFACRHYLLSDLSSGRIGPHDLTLRLVDERATLLMSVVHLDYVRRDLSLDHGSDRFSTFNDYGCAASA
jgi:hypothetical protein